MEICVCLCWWLRRHVLLLLLGKHPKNARKLCPFHLKPGPTFRFYMYYIICVARGSSVGWIASVCFMNVFL